MERNRAYSVLELIGWGKYNFIAFLQCGFVTSKQAWAIFDYWYESMAFVVDGVIEEWDLSTLQAGVVGSFIQIGLLFGSVFWAWIGGKYGRMYAFKTCIIVVSAASILLTFSPNFYVVSTALTILGFGIAGELSLPSTVFYEFCPPSKRFYITLMTLFQGFGAILVSLIAYLVSLFNYTGIYNWRIIVAVGAVVGIISMIFRFFMHETPAFLITQNKQVAADDVLNIISLKNTGEVLGKNENSSSLNPNEFTQEVEETPKEIENISENVARLFKPPLLKVTIVLSLVYFIQVYTLVSYSYSGYLYFMPEFLGEFSTSTAYLIILIQQSCGIPGVILGTYLVETRCGRKYTTLIFFVMTGLLILVFSFTTSFWFVWVIQILIASSISYVFIYLSYASMFTIGPESFPTSVRSSGSGVIVLLSRAGGISSPIITGYILELPNGVFLSLLSLCITFCAAGAFVFFLKETRGQKGG